jgi:hypothetical protein
MRQSGRRDLSLGFVIITRVSQLNRVSLLYVQLFLAEFAVFYRGH